MRQAEDVVWAAITNSARRRFDYADFKNQLNTSGDERTADFILFHLIEGLAENIPMDKLLLRIQGDLDLFDYSVSLDELYPVLADKNEILSAEIHAAREALSGFALGKSTSEMLEQVHKMLS